MGAAAVLLVFVETWPAAMVAAVLFGLGFGAYLAVDQALITQVLPAAADRAKDLGIINIAIVAPGAVGAALAGALVTLGGYPLLFAGTAAVAALGLGPGLADQERAVARRPSGRPEAEGQGDLHQAEDQQPDAEQDREGQQRQARIGQQDEAGARCSGRPSAPSSRGSPWSCAAPR